MFQLTSLMLAHCLKYKIKSEILVLLTCLKIFPIIERSAKIIVMFFFSFHDSLHLEKITFVDKKINLFLIIEKSQ